MNPELLSVTIPRRGCQTNDCWSGQETREVHRLRSNPGSWCKAPVSHTCQVQDHSVIQEKITKGSEWGKRNNYYFHMNAARQTKIVIIPSQCEWWQLYNCAKIVDKTPLCLFPAACMSSGQYAVTNPVKEEISFPMKSLPPGGEGVVVSKHREWRTGTACIGVVFTV